MNDSTNARPATAPARVTWFPCGLALGLLACTAGGDAVSDGIDAGQGALHGEGSASACVEARERTSATLACPGGTHIISIEFASYGRPAGSCDDGFEVRACHASSSRTQVEARCLGETSCTVPAGNDVFGDPCKGTRKNLAVVYSCSGDEDPGDCEGCGTPRSCDDYETELDGDIILAYDDTDRGIADSRNDNGVRIYDGAYKAVLTDADLRWEWTVRDARAKNGSPMPDDFKRRFSEKKNDAKPVWYDDELHILLASNAGNAVALIRVRDRRVVYWGDVGKAVHDAALMPDGNILVADSQKRRPGESQDYGAATVLSTVTDNDQSCWHKNAHGVTWDAARSLAWFWGGGGTMRAYRVTGDARNPELDCDSYTEYDVDVGPGVAHGFAPMLDGSRRLVGTIGSHVIWFDTAEVPDGPRWGYVRHSLSSGLKSISYNPETGEYIYVKNDGTNGLSYRSDTIRSLSGGPRRVAGDGAFYKARWFFSNCFALVGDE